MINKILFLVYNPPDKRDYERFGVKLLQDNGFEVEIKNTPDLEQIKNLTPSTLIINIVGYSLKSYPLYKAISKSQAKYAVLMANANPVPSASQSFMRRMRELTLYKLIDRTFQSLPYSLFGIKPASLILAGGEQCLKSLYPVRDAVIIWAHTLDYDIYLKEKDKKAREKPIAVFLDEYYPFHKDTLDLFGVKKIIDPDIYYSTLDKFFTKVEKEGLEVVIAAYPRSEYEKHPNCFRGRKIIKHKTCELVKNSKLVLLHNSTSVNFACLFHKPIIFLTSKEINEGRQAPLIRTMARWLGKKPLDMNNSVDLKQHLPVDKFAYDRYRQAYIKTDGSPEKPFWQIFADNIRRTGV